MKFTAVGTVFVKESGVVVEIEGNCYQVSKADSLKILEIRQLQGYKGLKEALHGAEMKFEVTRGSKAAALLITTAPISTPVDPTSTSIVITSPVWIDDSEGPEEGGYWEAETTIKGKKIKVECWKKKLKTFNGSCGCELRHAIADNGQHFWCIPLGLYAFWPDANFD